MGQYCPDPEYPENTSTEKSDYHGTESIPQGTQSAVESFHDAQKHVSCEHDFSPLHSPVDNLGIRIENRHKLRTEDVEAPPHNGTQARGTGKAAVDTVKDPLIIAGTPILGYKGYRCMEEGN